MENLGGVLTCSRIVPRLLERPQPPEEMYCSIAEQGLFVQEHPAGFPPGTILEEDQQEFAAFTQPRP